MYGYNYAYGGYNNPYYSNPVPDNLQQLRNNQMQQPMVQQPQQIQQPQPQTNNGLIWVQGEAGAKSYLVAPNTTIMLMDSEQNRFFLKSADASGMPLPLRTFEYAEITQNGNETAVNTQKSDLNIDLGKYVTRDELNEILANLTATSDTKKTAKKVEKENDNG